VTELMVKIRIKRKNTWLVEMDKLKNR